MEGKRKLFIGIVLAFFVGAIAGLFGGGYYGFSHGMSFVMNEALYRDAKQVQTQIVALKHLRAAETDQAVEVLESAMDDDLIIFDPEKPYAGISEQTFSEINKAINECREYRTTHPRKSNRPHVDAMVSNLLNRISREQ